MIIMVEIYALLDQFRVRCVVYLNTAGHWPDFSKPEDSSANDTDNPDSNKLSIQVERSMENL